MDLDWLTDLVPWRLEAHPELLLPTSSAHHREWPKSAIRFLPATNLPPPGMVHALRNQRT